MKKRLGRPSKPGKERLHIYLDKSLIKIAKQYSTVSGFFADAAKLFLKSEDFQKAMVEKNRSKK